VPTKEHRKAGADIVSALTARSRFGQILREVDEEQRCFVIEKRGVPKAIILGIKDYIRLAAPQPEILRIIGERSKRNKTNKLSMRRIDAIIRGARKGKRNKHAPAPTRA
jgi:prevent-host-death family protein